MRKSLLGLATLLLASRCATMVNQSTERIPVTSDPSGAVVTVNCGSAPLFGGVTPTTVTVPRAAQPCSVTVAKDGFAEQTISFQRQTSRVTAINSVPGVVAGTVLGAVATLLMWNTSDDFELPALAFEGGQLLGSAPGNAVDRRTGAAYKQVPGNVFVRLTPLDESS
ncbi:MAG: hypothetical protein ABIP63_10310 [Thermoanaerobaculia bacterium]